MSRPTVLVVDDHASVGLMFTRLLEDECRVLAARDAQEGRRVLEEERPDLVISDLRMPEGGGLEMLRASRALDPTVPVLILTGHATLDTAVEALRLGAFDYVRKPVEDPEAIRSLVRRALEYRSLLRERDRLVTDLEKANDFKASLLRSVSHDLQNQVSSFAGYVEMVEQDPDRTEVYLRRLRRVAAATLALVEDLSTYGRLDARQLTLHPARVDLSECARAAAELVLHDPSVHLIHLPSQPSWAMADRTRVVQVLTNLLSNAVKFSPRGGRVEVTVRPLGKLLEVWVEDEGVGIPAADLEQVFRPFFRCEPVAARIPGSGLGLSIVRSLVEMHGGTVAVEARERGTRFRFSLPAAHA